MASKQARAKALVDAITNRDTSLQIITDVVEALCGLEPEGVATLTTDEKLTLFHTNVRSFILDRVKAYKAKVAKAGIDEQVSTQVDTDLARE